MKKLTLVLAAGLLAATVTFAQREAKPGILPQKGDFAIGIAADPFFDYFGNMFSTNGSDAPTFDGTDGNFGSTPALVLYGKYFLEDNRALRARLNLNIGAETFKNSVQDQTATDVKMVEDKNNSFYTDIELSLGYEYRRGYGRLQVLWGYEATLGFSSGPCAKLDYANGYSSTYTTPVSTDWGFPAPQGRTTKYNYGTDFLFRPAVFAGVEYYFAPKMSLGGEFNVGVNLYTQGKAKQSYEYWDGSTVVSKDRDISTVGKMAFQGNIWTTARGNIYLMFHF